MLNKMGVIGGGNIGGVLVQEIARRGLARTIALVDPAPFVNPNDDADKQATTAKQSIAKGKALDILEGSPVLRADVKFEASKTYEVLEGCEIVINTAGVPRKARPDGTFPSREELLAVNLKITSQVAEGINTYCKGAKVISIANPLDAIVYTLDKKLNPEKGTLMGMAGVLDSARYRYFIAEKAGVSVSNVEAMVLGGHGDTMVPIRSCCRVAGMPVEMFVNDEDLLAIETRTRKAGGEVVGLLGIGSAFVSPALSALQMAEAIIFDRKMIMPVSAKLNGQYGVDNLFIGVPALLGKNGIEKIIELDITDDEKAALGKSIEAVKSTAAAVEKMLSE